MSYVDGIFNKNTSIINIVERVGGKRIYKEYPADYSFYVADPKGTHRSIYGDPVIKVKARTADEILRLKRMHSQKKTFESDINQVFKCIEANYLNQESPALHVAFFDIETDFDKDRGYSSPEEAFNPITSIAVYLQWLEQIVCLAVPPKTLTIEEGETIAKIVGNTIIFDNEADMLSTFLTLIEDADVISGWNSEGFDIPYTVNRVTKLLGKPETRKFCLWNHPPKKRKYERFGTESVTYDTIGRIHLDYLQLYKKYNYEERHSYSLNNIGELEVGEKKVDYKGTLDQLYNNDFEKFLRYNIQDTMLLDRIDKKLQFIDLANSIAHGNAVLLPSTMGAVAVTEQAITVEAHVHGLVVPDKNRDDKGDIRAAGGWVQHPKKGFHEWIGSSDLNSLYPSVLRALNASPETIVGQLRTNKTLAELHAFESSNKSTDTFASWWNDRFNTLEMQNFLDNDNYETMFLDMEDGSTFEVTGAELRQLVFDSGQPWCISANGTIFNTTTEGIIPRLLSRWYSERKALKYRQYSYMMVTDNEKLDGISISDTIFTDNDIDLSVKLSDPYHEQTAFDLTTMKKLINEGDKDKIIEYINLHHLHVRNNKVVARNQTETKKYISFWDKRQLVKKINLNSLYGGLLNQHCRYFDQRLGQSTTLTGRTIAKHMAARTNELITGIYDHTGESIIYGDTDSVYFSAYPTLKPEIESGKFDWNKESVIDLYDNISKMVSDSFPEHLLKLLNIPLQRSEGVIAAGREIVAISGLFIVKKRYACLVYDNEGERMDVNGKHGKLKSTGLDLRRSDTQKVVQDFLSDILLYTLLGRGEDHVIGMIREFKEKFENMRPWEKGAPKSVNNLSSYKDMLDIELMGKMKFGGPKVKNARLPGHVRGSINWNNLRDLNNDFHTMKAVDGSKIAMCYLLENRHKITSICYPVDEPHLPLWFTELPFDEKTMMEKNVDKKVENLLGVLKWDLSRTSKDSELMESLFDFSKF